MYISFTKLIPHASVRVISSVFFNWIFSFNTQLSVTELLVTDNFFLNYFALV